MDTKRNGAGSKVSTFCAQGEGLRQTIFPGKRTIRCRPDPVIPPTSSYIPPDAIAPGVPRHARGSSFCEWKGTAIYWDVVIGDVILSRVGWSYPNSSPAFAILRDHVAFYAAPFERCSVNGQMVVAQAGGFYGGWMTRDLAGPFEGIPRGMR